MKKTRWWCDKCKKWMRPSTVSTVYRCPFCYTELMFEKPPEEVSGDG